MPCQEHVQQVLARSEDLRSHHTRVMIITFGEEHMAQMWSQRYGDGVPLLMDHERRIYDAYGLRHSILRTWTPATLWFYFKLFVRSGRIAPILGDPHQMGGDVIISRDGVVRYIHRSTEPVDRPEVGDLFTVMRRINR